MTVNNDNVKKSNERNENRDGFFFIIIIAISLCGLKKKLNARTTSKKGDYS